MSLSDSDLKEMREQYAHGIQVEDRAHTEFSKDMGMFVGDEQWEATLKEKRRKTGRPSLTLNLLPEKIQQIVNASKMNKPAGKVSPVEDSDQSTAKVMQGLGRHIEYMNQGQLAYNTAYEHACIGGFGYWRYNTQWADEDSMDQDLVIEPVYDPLCIVADSDAKRGDGADGKYWFVTEEIGREEFKRKWPKASVVSAGFNDTLIAKAKSWFRGENITVAEYWRDDVTTAHKVAIPDFQSTKGYSLVIESQIPLGVEVVRNPKTGKALERDVEEHNWVCFTTNGLDTLDEQPWAGRFAPFVRITGKRLIHKGRVYYISAIRNSRDAQIMLNYAESSATEATMLSTKAPWIGWKGQFKDKRWAEAHLINYAYLELEPTYGLNGELLPPPQRNIYEPPIQALSMIAVRAGEYIKSTMGIYNPSLGNGEAQRSGKAELLLQKAGDMANYHLFDNLCAGIWQGWRILLDMIPKTYDTERQVRVLGEDERQEIVKVNAQFVDKSGQPKHYDLGAGKFDCTIEVGPAYNTMRQEAAANMSSFAQAIPDLVPRWADLYVKAQDWPLKDQIAKRITPPEFADKDEQNQVSPQIQQQMAQMSKIIEAQTEELKQVSQALEQKKLELESKERIAAESDKTQLIVAAMRTQSTEAIAQMQAQINSLNQRLQLLHEGDQLRQEHDFQASQSAQINSGGQPNAAE